MFGDKKVMSMMFKVKIIIYFRICKLCFYVVYIIDNYFNYDFYDESKVENSLVMRFGFVVMLQEFDFLEMILVFLRNFG